MMMELMFGQRREVIAGILIKNIHYIEITNEFYVDILKEKSQKRKTSKVLLPKILRLYLEYFIKKIRNNLIINNTQILLTLLINKNEKTIEYKIFTKYLKKYIQNLILI